MKPNKQEDRVRKTWQGRVDRVTWAGEVGEAGKSKGERETKG